MIRIANVSAVRMRDLAVRKVLCNWNRLVTKGHLARLYRSLDELEQTQRQLDEERNKEDAA